MFTLNDILQGNDDTVRLQGASSADIEQVFPSAQHDSRQVGQGELFIAIKGEHVDGHSFIPAAAQAGAGAVLCTEPSSEAPAEFLQIIVPHVVPAFHATARVPSPRPQHTTLIGISPHTSTTTSQHA